MMNPYSGALSDILQPTDQLPQVEGATHAPTIERCKATVSVRSILARIFPRAEAAEALPHGQEHEALISKAREIETTSRIKEWLYCPRSTTRQPLQTLLKSAIRTLFGDSAFDTLKRSLGDVR
jgi:hypothetical protein